MIVVHEVTQGTLEWHELRQDKYTGSNAHKLLKFGAVKYAITEQQAFSGNFFTERGHLLEEEAIGLYEIINSCVVQRPGFVSNSLYPGCGYSPDGIQGSPGRRDRLRDVLLEVKCFNEKKHLAIAKGEVPVEILAQIHFGLLICGLTKARLILYNPDLAPELALKVIEVSFNRNIQNNFKKILSKAEVKI